LVNTDPLLLISMMTAPDSMGELLNRILPTTRGDEVAAAGHNEGADDSAVADQGPLLAMKSWFREDVRPPAIWSVAALVPLRR